MSRKRDFFRMFYTTTASSKLQSDDVRDHVRRLWDSGVGTLHPEDEPTWMLQSLEAQRIDIDRLRNVITRLEPLLTDEQIDAVMK